MKEEMAQRMHQGASKNYMKVTTNIPARQQIKRTISKISERVAQKGECPKRV